MDYYNSYIKYKFKYINLKNKYKCKYINLKYKCEYKYIIGGAIDLKQQEHIENTKIIPEKFINNHTITDPSILNLLNDAYKTDIKEFIPLSKEGDQAIMWKILYRDKLVGFGVTTDLAQFEKYDNFISKGGIKDAKGLYITSIAGDSKYSGVVGLLFEHIDKYAIENDYDYLLLEAKKYEPNYLVDLYSRYGFIKIKELTEDGEVGTLMCKDIKEGFECVSRIK